MTEDDESALDESVLLEVSFPYIHHSDHSHNRNQVPKNHYTTNNPLYLASCDEDLTEKRSDKAPFQVDGVGSFWRQELKQSIM